jgi:hypothetical protein
MKEKAKEVWYKSDVMVHAYKPGYLGDGGRKISSSRPTWTKLERPYLKKRGGTTQVVEHLPIMCKSLNSIEKEDEEEERKIENSTFYVGLVL